MGQSWTDVDEVKDNTANITDRTIEPVEAQYVRLVILESTSISGNNRTSIVELAVYTKASEGTMRYRRLVWLVGPLWLLVSGLTVAQTSGLYERRITYQGLLGRIPRAPRPQVEIVIPAVAFRAAKPTDSRF